MMTTKEKIRQNKGAFILFAVLTIYFVITFFVPDPLPLVDEILSGGGAIGIWLKKFASEYGQELINTATYDMRKSVNKSNSEALRKLGNNVIDSSAQMANSKLNEAINRDKNSIIVDSKVIENSSDMQDMDIFS